MQAHVHLLFFHQSQKLVFTVGMISEVLRAGSYRRVQFTEANTLSVEVVRQVKLLQIVMWSKLSFQPLGQSEKLSVKQEEEVLIDSPLQLAQSVSQQQEEDMEGTALSFRLSEYRGTSFSASAQLSHLRIEKHPIQFPSVFCSVMFFILLSGGVQINGQ